MDMTDRAALSRLKDLNRAECLELLGNGAFVGRVGFVHGDRPLILPVNYLLDDESIVFRTAGGTVLSALDGAQVAFEVDDNRPLGHGGWSVVIQGKARAITDAQELDRVQRGPLRSWAWVAADRSFRIAIDVLSGRRVPES